MFKFYLKLLQKSRPSAGWTLAELMIAAAMTLFVVMAAGFGLIMILQENKVANATGEMQYDLNRATDFISEEIRNAKTIETKTRELRDTAQTFWKYWQENPEIQPILALKIDGMYERVVYYVEEVEPEQIWRGPVVIKRFGPDFKDNGGHDEDLKSKPSQWQHRVLVDMMASDLDPEQKQCKNLPDTTSDPDTYIAVDGQGTQWYRWPQADADVKGFYSCISKNKQLAQLNVTGTSADEFGHLYEKDKDKAEKTIRDKKTRHTAQMEYSVTTMVHARSEVIGSSGEDVPRYILNPGIIFEEPGKATLTVLHAEIPCSDDVTTTSDITANFVTVDDGVSGTIIGTGTGEPQRFSENEQTVVHLRENIKCSSPNGHELLRDNGNTTHFRFATNDNSDHPKLNDIIPNPSSTIVNKLTQEGFIKRAQDGSYDFTLPDNVAIYFVEFAFHKDIYDYIRDEMVDAPQSDPPHFDDYIYFVEMTK